MRRVAAALLAVSALGASPALAKAPGRMLVSAREFTLVSSRQVLPAGTSYVQLANDGEDGHDLAIRRVGKHGRPTGKTIRFPETAPGQVTTRKLHLERGRYALWCTLPGHRKAGMHFKLRVR